jgi:hypothetical protein
MKSNWAYINKLNTYYTIVGKRELFISNGKRSGYNLTPTVNTTSKPLTHVPSKGPSSITQQDFPSFDDPIRIGTHLMVI